jgi:hypothetical protein
MQPCRCARPELALSLSTTLKDCTGRWVQKTYIISSAPCHCNAEAEISRDSRMPATGWPMLLWHSTNGNCVNLVGEQSTWHQNHQDKGLHLDMVRLWWKLYDCNVNNERQQCCSLVTILLFDTCAIWLWIYYCTEVRDYQRPNLLFGMSLILCRVNKNCDRCLARGVVDKSHLFTSREY